MRTEHTVVPRRECRKLAQSLHDTGQKLVFTNGVFDILHIGHLNYLKEAKALGDVLIVGINSDSSTSNLKGADRPLVHQNERAKIVSSLYFVDYVIIFQEATPKRLILEIRPDIYVKGGDYRLEDLPEVKTVISYGGNVQILSYEFNKSTTNIIRKIIKTYRGEAKRNKKRY
jgi:rfaE bifunctional protein nucleotidyltransferase chain/domain